MKRIAVMGSTGSVGRSTLEVARHLGLPVTALAAHSNSDLLEEQIREFQPQIVALFDEKKALELQKRVACPVLCGRDGMDEIAAHSNVDFVVMAILGMAALRPTLAAIEAQKEIGLANKEILVSAGELVTARAREKKVELIPIDSEHSAIFQCLHGAKKESLRRVILTASGGPFRNHSAAQLKKVTLQDALAHPTWTMGKKITIDSSTLMNKGFEMIETSFLFDLPASMIDVVIHPQSIVHSFVEYLDGSMLAQLCEPHMVFPIQYALTHPQRREGMFAPFDFTKHSKLEFFAPDAHKFPALHLAQSALQERGSFGCYLNAANEVLVERFLNKELAWHAIVSSLECLLAKHNVVAMDCLDTILAVDQEARHNAQKVQL